MILYYTNQFATKPKNGLPKSVYATSGHYTGKLEVTIAREVLPHHQSPGD